MILKAIGDPHTKRQGRIRINSHGEFAASRTIHTTNDAQYAPGSLTLQSIAALLQRATANPMQQTNEKARNPPKQKLAPLTLSRSGQKRRLPHLSWNKPEKMRP
eukprot:scaffold194847_cov30-Tisochrysis_lutea.AAC.1